MIKERSANEVYGCTLKAGRGVGLPLKQVMEFASFLASCADDAMISSAVVHLQSDAQMTNSGGGGGLVLENVHLIRDMPVIALTAQTATICIKSFAYVPDTLTMGFCSYLGVALNKGEGCWQVASAQKLAGTPRRARISQEVWEQLDALAALTYVPETADSRTQGAGAGLTDND